MQNQTNRIVKAILANFLLAGMIFILFGASSFTAVQAQGISTPTPKTLNGTLGVVWFDKNTPENTSAQIYLFEENGTAYLLDIPEELRSQLGEMYALNNRRAAVSGILQTDQLQALSTSTQSILEVTSIDIGAAALGVSAAVPGAKPWINILCKFNDVPDEPKAVFYFQNLFGNGFGQMNHYWQTVSYGNINTNGSAVVSHWYTLPSNRGAYFTSDGRANLQKLATECIGAANAEVNYPSYFGVNLMFNAELDGFAWGGGWYLNIDGVSKYFPLTWMPPWGYGNQSSLGHEMGHALGLPHSSGPYGLTYDSHWDIMSFTWECIQITTYGCLGTDTISYHKNMLGWIPAGRRYDSISGTNRSVVIERLNQIPSNPDSFMMAKVMIPGTSRFYTVEVRDNVTNLSNLYLPFDEYDDGIPSNNYSKSLSPNAPVVVIHEVNPSRTNEAQVVDQSVNNDPNDEGAMWRPGETFIDATHNIRISVLEAAGNGYRVSIRNGNTPNDGISSPLIISSTPFSFDEDTTAADTDLNDPLFPCAGNVQGQNTVWFKFRPAAYGMAKIDTANSSFDTILAVWTGTPSALTNVACDNNGGANQTSALSFEANQGTTYYIEVAGVSGGGDLSFHLDMTACYSPILNVLPSGAGVASVLTSPHCPGNRYESGTSITISATPNGGYTFKSWSGGSTSTTNPLTISINSNQTFTANFVPASTTPVLVSPPNSSLTRDYTPLLKWKPAVMPAGSFFDHYQLQVATDSGFGSIVLNEDITTSEYTPSTELLSNTKFFWRVRVFNNIGNFSVWSAIWNFRTALAPPTLVSPADAFAAIELRPLFDWNDVSGASGYTIQISKNNTFTLLVHTGYPVGSSYVPTVNLPKNMTLYWRVRTRGTNGPSAWTSSRSMTTPVNPPPPPALLLPASNALVTDYTPTFAWKAVLMPAGTILQNYIIQVDNNAEFSSPEINDNTPVTSTFTPSSNLAPNTKFYWRVRAVNNSGEMSNWSAVRYFRAALLPPTLLAPATGATVVSTRRPTFDWNDITGARTYTIQVSRNATFTLLVVNANTVASTYTPAVNLPANITLYWRVRARGTNGPSLWAPLNSYFTFTIVP